MNSASSTVNDAIGKFLLAIGVFGCIVVTSLVAVFPFIAVGDPRLSEVLAIAALGIPFFTYIFAVWKRWRRSMALAVGIPAHFAWLLFLRYPGDDGQFLMGAAVLFALFVWYALKLPTATPSG